MHTNYTSVYTCSQNIYCFESTCLINEPPIILYNLYNIKLDLIVKIHLIFF